MNFYLVCDFEKKLQSAHLPPSFSAEEIEESQENGEIAVTCEFCSTTYRFPVNEVAAAE